MPDTPGKRQRREVKARRRQAKDERRTARREGTLPDGTDEPRWDDTELDSTAVLSERAAGESDLPAEQPEDRPAPDAAG
jgi:hypothetical protein